MTIRPTHPSGTHPRKSVAGQGSSPGSECSTPEGDPRGSPIPAPLQKWGLDPISSPGSKGIGIALSSMVKWAPPPQQRDEPAPFTSPWSYPLTSTNTPSHAPPGRHKRAQKNGTQRSGANQGDHPHTQIFESRTPRAREKRGPPRRPQVTSAWNPLRAAMVAAIPPEGEVDTDANFASDPFFGVGQRENPQGGPGTLECVPGPPCGASLGCCQAALRRETRRGVRRKPTPPAIRVAAPTSRKVVPLEPVSASC